MEECNGTAAEVCDGRGREGIVHRSHPPHGDSDGRPGGSGRRLLLPRGQLAGSPRAGEGQGRLHRRLHAERLALCDREGGARGGPRRDVREAAVDHARGGGGTRGARRVARTRARDSLHLFGLSDGQARARPGGEGRARPHRQGRARVPAGLVPQDRLLEAARQAQRLEDGSRAVGQELRRRGHRRPRLPPDRVRDGTRRHRAARGPLDLRPRQPPRRRRHDPDEAWPNDLNELNLRNLPDPEGDAFRLEGGDGRGERRAAARVRRQGVALLEPGGAELPVGEVRLRARAHLQAQGAVHGRGVRSRHAQLAHSGGTPRGLHRGVREHLRRVLRRCSRPPGPRPSGRP